MKNNEAHRLIRYEIYQLPAGHPDAFLGLFPRHGQRIYVKRTGHELVYAGKTETAAPPGEFLDILERIFVKFNLKPPVDYRGRSLGVSDIISLNGQPFFYDNFGWFQVLWQEEH